MLATSICLAGFISAGCAPTARTEAPEAVTPRYADQAEGVYVNGYVPDDDGPPPPNFVVRTLYDAGATIGHGFSYLADVPVRIYKSVYGEKPSTAARRMEDASSADSRRQGINELMQFSFSKQPPYTNRYRQIAVYDPDPTVRAAAVRASNRSRDRLATTIWVAALRDKSELVRLEAAKALVHLPDPSASDPLIAALNNPEENRDVRIAAADALKHYRRLPVARALSLALNDRDFGVAWQSRRSLRYLTGRDFKYDGSAWLAYFTGPNKPLE